MKLEDLSDLFTKEGVKKLKKGQLLRFNYEGSTTEFIIKRLNKKSGVVMGELVTTYHPDEVQTEDKFGDKAAFNVDDLDGKA